MNVDEVYTFGLPRVGDDAFSEWFKQQLPQAIHVTHYDDVRAPSTLGRRLVRRASKAGATVSPPF